MPAFAVAGCGCTGRCHHPHGCLAGLGNLLERLCPWSSSSAPPSPLLGCQIGHSEPPSHLQLSPNLYSQWSERRKHCRNVLHFPWHNFIYVFFFFFTAKFRFFFFPNLFFQRVYWQLATVNHLLPTHAPKRGAAERTEGGSGERADTKQFGQEIRGRMGLFPYLQEIFSRKNMQNMQGGSWCKKKTPLQGSCWWKRGARGLKIASSGI